MIGYVIVRHSLPAQELLGLLYQSVEAMTDDGMLVDAIIMDQESSQWKLIN